MSLAMGLLNIPMQVLHQRLPERNAQRAAHHHQLGVCLIAGGRAKGLAKGSAKGLAEGVDGDGCMFRPNAGGTQTQYV